MLDVGTAVALVCGGFPFWDEHIGVFISSGSTSHTTQAYTRVWGNSCSPWTQYLDPLEYSFISPNSVIHFNIINGSFEFLLTFINMAMCASTHLFTHPFIYLFNQSEPVCGRQAPYTKINSHFFLKTNNCCWVEKCSLPQDGYISVSGRQWCVTL